MRDSLRLDVYFMRPGRLRLLSRWDSGYLRKNNYLVGVLDLYRPIELLSLRLPPAQLLDDVVGSVDTLVLLAHYILRVLRLFFLILLLRVLIA